MFMNICELCKEEPQFRTVEAEFPEGKKKLNVCMDCAYAIEDLEKKDEELRNSIEQAMQIYESLIKEVRK